MSKELKFEELFESFDELYARYYDVREFKRHLDATDKENGDDEVEIYLVDDTQVSLQRADFLPLIPHLDAILIKLDAKMDALLVSLDKMGMIKNFVKKHIDSDVEDFDDKFKQKHPLLSR